MTVRISLTLIRTKATATPSPPSSSTTWPGASRRLLHDGRPVGTIDLPGDTLPLHLTGLADLRVRPLALAHYLLSVPDETLRRTGHILIEMLEARRRRAGNP